DAASDSRHVLLLRLCARELKHGQDNGQNVSGSMLRLFGKHRLPVLSQLALCNVQVDADEPPDAPARFSVRAHEIEHPPRAALRVDDAELLIDLLGAARFKL